MGGVKIKLFNFFTFSQKGGGGGGAGSRLGRVDFEKKIQKLPMDTQGFLCVTLTKRYNLVWDSGGAV